MLALALATAPALHAQTGAAPIPKAAGAVRPSQAIPTTTQPGPYGQARALLSQGRAAEAERLLRAWQPADAAGTEQKLWALAVLMRDTGRPAEALRYLEPLVAARPDVATFRLAMGEVLQTLGQDERAALHLREARGGQLTDDQRDRVQRSLAGLDQGRVWSGQFALRIEPGSNPAKATRLRHVTIDGLPFTIRDGARERAATGLGLSAGLAYAPAIGAGTRARLALALDATLYDGGAPDDILARAEAGLLHGALQTGRFKAGVTFTRRWIDGQPYSTAPGVTLGYARLIGASGRLDAAASVEWHRHDRAAALDGPRSLLFLGYSHALSPQLFLRGGLRLERTAAKAGAYALSAGELSLGAGYAFQGGLMVSLDLALRRALYDDPSPIFRETRRDDRVSATLRVLHRNVSWQGFAPVLELKAERQTSTIGFHGYDNMTASLGITRQF